MAVRANYPSGVAGIQTILVNADSTNWVDLYDNSVGSASVRVESLSICSDDTVTMNIQFGRNISSVTYLLGTVRAVTLVGTDGAVARINALSTIGTAAPDGVNVIEVPAGQKLQAKVLIAVTAAKTVSITGWARLYV